MTPEEKTKTVQKLESTLHAAMYDASKPDSERNAHFSSHGQAGATIKAWEAKFREDILAEDRRKYNVSGNAPLSEEYAQGLNARVDMLLRGKIASTVENARKALDGQKLDIKVDGNGAVDFASSAVSDGPLTALKNMFSGLVNQVPEVVDWTRTGKTWLVEQINGLINSQQKPRGFQEIYDNIQVERGNTALLKAFEGSGISGSEASQLAKQVDDSDGKVVSQPKISNASPVPLTAPAITQPIVVTQPLGLSHPVEVSNAAIVAPTPSGGKYAPAKGMGGGVGHP